MSSSTSAVRRPREPLPQEQSSASQQALRERSRLAALNRYRILDTEAESAFDELAQLASHVCQTPMALVSLVDADRQWFKARMGLDVCSTSREVAFCAHAVELQALLIVEDATVDPRFANNPLVTGPPSIRFYAGAPLMTAQGHVLGTLCVLDTKSRTLSEVQRRLLLALARQVMDQLEHRRQTDALAAEVASHEVARVDLARQRQFDGAVLETVSAGVLACDSDGRIVLRNAAQRRLTAMQDGDDIGADRVSGRLQLLAADGTELPPSSSPLRQALAGGELLEEPMRIGPIAGPLHDVLVTARQIRDAAGTLLGAVAAFTDITSERAAQAQLQESGAFHDAVLAASPDIIFVVDPRTHTSVWSSRNLMEMLGYEIEQLTSMGSSIIETLVHPEDVAGLIASNEDACRLADGEVVQLRYRARHANGQWLWLSRRTTPFARDEQGVVTQLLGVARDITDIVEVEERLEAAALHDSLTGLPNRTLLADRLRSALSRGERSGLEVAVLFCDLDGFKRVNDTAGHAAGDSVLTVTAHRLQAELRQEDTVARVGGDEFVIVVEPVVRSLDDSAAPNAVQNALAIADRIRAALSQPIVFEDVSHLVTASIGIALGSPGATADEVLRRADAAMYQAKNLGKDRAVMEAAAGNLSSAG